MNIFNKSRAYAPTVPHDAVTLEVNNHNDSSDLPEERPAASLSVYYGRSAALVVLILNREASKQLVVYCEQRKLSGDKRPSL